MEKIKTGISGFDALVKGGLPAGSCVLLSGTPGTGKTIFALEYIYRGALEGDKGLYISLEEQTQSLRDQASNFGWDFEALEKKGMITLMYIPTSSITNSTIKEIQSTVSEYGIKRLVLDSVSTLSLAIPTIQTVISDITEFSIKRFVHNFIDEIKGPRKTTILLISQTSDDKKFSSDEVSEFMSDGIIHIVYESMGGEYSRSLIVRKMRQVKNDEDIHPLEISNKGIVVHTLK